MFHLILIHLAGLYAHWLCEVLAIIFSHGIGDNGWISVRDAEVELFA